MSSFDINHLNLCIVYTTRESSQVRWIQGGQKVCNRPSQVRWFLILVSV